MSQLEFLYREPDAEPEETERCLACGQTIKKLNPHRMDASKVRVLLDMALLDARAPDHPWVLAKAGNVLRVERAGKVADERKTSYRAREHASRLFWYGLLDYAGNRTGAYRINAAGLAFINGSGSVPERIWCRDGEVLDQDPKLVTIFDVRGVVLTTRYWDGYAEWQSYRN